MRKRRVSDSATSRTRVAYTVLLLLLAATGTGCPSGLDEDFVLPSRLLESYTVGGKEFGDTLTFCCADGEPPVPQTLSFRCLSERDGEPFATTYGDIRVDNLRNIAPSSITFTLSDGPELQVSEDWTEFEFEGRTVELTVALSGCGAPPADGARVSFVVMLKVRGEAALIDVYVEYRENCTAPVVSVSPRSLEFCGDASASFPQVAGKVSLAPDFGPNDELRGSSTIVLTIPSGTIEGPLAFEVDGQEFLPGSDEATIDDVTSIRVLASAAIDQQAAFDIELKTTYLDADSMTVTDILTQRITILCRVPGDPRYPEIAADGDDVYVVWADPREHPDTGLDNDVYVNRSSDGGVTWPNLGLRMNTDAAGADHSSFPQICAEGGSVYVAWSDDRDGDGAIYFNVTENDGAGGLSPVPTDQRINSSSGYYPSIGCGGDNVYVAWVAQVAGGSLEVRFNRSTNRGEDWLNQDEKLNDSLRVSNTVALIAASGDDVYVAWPVNESAGRSIAVNRSHDGGKNWEGALVIGTPTLAGPVASFDICADEAGAYIAWAQPEGLYCRHFDNDPSVEAWEDTVKLSDEGDDTSSRIDASCRGDTVAVVWHDGEGLTVPGRIYFNRSKDGGATWMTNDLRLDSVTGTEPTESGGSSPKVHCTSQRYWVIWREKNNGDEDIKARGLAVQASGDPTVSGNPISLAQGARPDPWQTRWPELAGGEDGVVATWGHSDQDQPDNYYALHGNRLDETDYPQGLPKDVPIPR